MEMLILNISLVVVGTATAAAAVFGETREGNRLTRIGWIALLGCVATFSIGVAKELLSKYENDVASTRGAERERVADERAVTTSDQLTKALQALERSNSKLDELDIRMANLERLNQAETARAEVKTQAPTVPSGTFAGQVVNLSGGPIPGVEVTAISDRGLVLGRVRTDTSGEFQLALQQREPGAVNLLFSARGLPTKKVGGLDSSRGQYLAVVLP